MKAAFINKSIETTHEVFVLKPTGSQEEFN